MQCNAIILAGAPGRQNWPERVGPSPLAPAANKVVSEGAPGRQDRPERARPPTPGEGPQAVAGEEEPDCSPVDGNARGCNHRRRRPVGEPGGPATHRLMAGEGVEPSTVLSGGADRMLSTVSLRPAASAQLATSGRWGRPASA
eukprot:scaffold654241_cov41-Prasinocladus_malaysianus.AAC.1